MAVGRVEPKHTFSGQTGLTCPLSAAGGQSGPVEVDGASRVSLLALPPELFHPGQVAVEGVGGWGPGAPSPAPSSSPSPAGLSLGMDRGGWCPLLVTPTFPSLTAQKQRGRGAAQSETLASSPPCSEGGARCSAPGSNRGTPGPACHMLGDEPRSGEQACPAGFLAPGAEEADQRGELPEVVGEDGSGSAAGIGPVGPPLGSWLRAGPGSRWGE